MAPTSSSSTLNAKWMLQNQMWAALPNIEDPNACTLRCTTLPLKDKYQIVQLLPLHSPNSICPSVRQ
jgi:hypothetical protein